MESITDMMNLPDRLTMTWLDDILRSRFPEFVGVMSREYGVVAYFYHDSGVKLTYHFCVKEVSEIDIEKHLHLIRAAVTRAIVSHLFDDDGVL